MYYVKLKENQLIQPYMKELVDNLSQESYEKRFPFEDKLVEVYKLDTLEECQKFLNNIDDANLKNQFEIVKCDE